MPSVDRPEKVELYWNGTYVDHKSWTSAIPSSDLFIEVTTDKLIEGVNSLKYIVTLYNGTSTPSMEHSVTVDRRAPTLGTYSELVFPAAIVNNGVTAEYLAAPANGDKVKATVPTWVSPAPGQAIIGYWEESAAVPQRPIPMPPLTAENYNQPVVLTFTGALIRDRGDGQRLVTYRVESRAGYASQPSRAVELKVAVNKAPRFLPWPWVEEVGGTPAQTGTLDPQKALNGVTVRIPSEVVFYDEDTPAMQWAEPGAVGADRVPFSVEQREVKIHKSKIAAHLGKNLKVYYEIPLSGAEPMKSDIFTLTVSEYPRHRLPAPQIDGHSDPVSQSSVPPEGLNILQQKWPFIATDNLISITISDGVSGGLEEKVLDKKPVTADQVRDGVTRGEAVVTQKFMQRLQTGKRFTVQTSVSFDNGVSWKNFTALTPMLNA